MSCAPRPPPAGRPPAGASPPPPSSVPPRGRSAPEPDVLRGALSAGAFTPGTRNVPPPAGIAAALEWAAAATTQRRKRAVFYNALGCAVEVELLGANPVDRIQWKAPDVAETVDRRVVVSPAQARTLLAGVRAQGARGEHLEAFFGCLYYAALRPSEAVALREADGHRPGGGWGRIDLAASEPRARRGWTDDGAARQARGLKHRAEHEMRSIPIPPALNWLLRAHLRAYGTSPDGRLFRTARGRPLHDSACSAVWPAARAAALTPPQQASPLARRPHD